MGATEERRIMLAHWLTQRKLAERARDAARDELDKWYKRARLALDKGDVDLARIAKDRAAQAADTHRQIVTRLDTIQAELDIVRSEQWVPGQDHFDAAQRRVRATAESFAELGVHSSIPTVAGSIEAILAVTDAAALREAEALLDDAVGGDDPGARGGEL